MALVISTVVTIIISSIIITNLDGSVPRSRHNVVEVEVDDVDCSPVTEEHPTEVDLLRADDVPHGNRSVLMTMSKMESSHDDDDDGVMSQTRYNSK